MDVGTIEAVETPDDAGLLSPALKKPSGLKSEQDLPVSCTFRLNAAARLRSDTKWAGFKLRGLTDESSSTGGAHE